MFELKLLGQPQLTKDGQSLKAVRPKSLALLSYLIIEERSFSRLHLLTIFWPQQDETAGRRNLSWTLNNLKSHIPRCLDVQGESIAYNFDCALSIDVLAFAMHVAQSDNKELQIAIDNYAGPLMDGFFLRGCAEFEQWHTEHQEAYRQRFVAALARLIPLYKRHPHKALGVADRWLAVDEWEEHAHQARMVALAQLGRKADALAHFEQLAARLDAELGVGPNEATQALAEQVRTDQIKRVLTEKVGYVPEPPTELFGRITEQKRINSLLLEKRAQLTTLMGHGGIGKTHLALTIGRDLMTEFPDGVWFVPLETVQGDGAAVTLTILEALGVRPSGSDPPMDHLARYLNEKALLLILDNFEHLADCAPSIADLMQDCSALQLLVTSRIRLNLPGEQVVRLTGLPIETDSRQLFDERSERYSAVWRDGDLSTQNSAIHAICELVEGLPLGIELAAATDDDPITVLAALEANLHTITTTMHDVPARQRSLFATFTYSWNLLSAELQTIVAGAAHFEGGWTAEAAQVILGATDMQLQQLVDRSLFSIIDGRYRMHRLVARFSAEKQPTPPTEFDTFFANTLYDTLVDFRREHDPTLWEGVVTDIPNILKAWHMLVAARAVEQLVPFTKGLFAICGIQGRLHMGLDTFGTALAQFETGLDGTISAENRRLIGMLSARAGYFNLFLGNIETAKELFDSALETALALDAKPELELILTALGDIAKFTGNYAEALRITELILTRVVDGNPDRQHRALSNQALALVEIGRLEEARSKFYAVLEYHRTKGDTHSLATTLNNLGHLLLVADELAKAQAVFEEALAIRQANGNQHRIGACYLALGHLAVVREDGALALENYQKASQLFVESGVQRGQGAAHIGLGAAYLILGQIQSARDHIANAQKLTQKRRDAPHAFELFIVIGQFWSAVGRKAQALELFFWVAGHEIAHYGARLNAINRLEQMGGNSAEITSHKSPWLPRLQAIKL